MQALNTSFLNKLKSAFVAAFVCSLLGGIVAHILLPLYIKLDLVRQAGLAKHESVTLSSADVVALGWLLMAYGLIQGPAVFFLRHNKRTAFVVYLLIGQWLPMLLLLLFATDEGIWFRGVLNVLSFSTIALGHWFLTWRTLQFMESKKILTDNKSQPGVAGVGYTALRRP